MEDVDLFLLKKEIEKLKKIEGRGTELISVYIPAGYDIRAIQRHLEQEWSTAQNIKSKTTRKNVMDALEKIIQAIKNIKETPKNGLVIFCGNIAPPGEERDIRLWMIEPPRPVPIRIYRCDKRFVVEPLEELLKPQGVWGLVVLDSKEACIGVLEGKKITVLKRMESIVPGKTRAGGQSSVRFQRVREGLLNDWLKKIADTMKEIFLGMENLKGIIIGGPGPIKERLYYEDYLDPEIKKKVVAVKDVGYTDEEGLKELIARSEDILAREDVIKEKKIVNEFLKHIAKDTGYAIYGYEMTKKALEIGAVRDLLIAEDVEESKMKELIELAKNYGTNVYIVSRDTEEGAQFVNTFKIGGILRYRIEEAWWG